MKKKLKNLSLNQKDFYESDKDEDIDEDPMVLKKQGIEYFRKKDISYYKKKIIDENYLDHAIQRIAMELSHFILKDR